MVRESIRIEAPDQPDVLRLLAASDAYHMSLYPPESLYLLDPAALRAPGVSFYVARIDGAVSEAARSYAIRMVLRRSSGCSSRPPRAAVGSGDGFSPPSRPRRGNPG